MGFFNGPATDLSGGAGVYIWISDTHHLSIKLGCGRSTNTRAELLALWALLYISKEICLPHIHIFGDSSVIINWAKDNSALSILNLEAWCVDIKLLISSFSAVEFKHVYREHNERANTLSKEGLTMASGHLTFTDSCEGIVDGEVSVQLF